MQLTFNTAKEADDFCEDLGLEDVASDAASKRTMHLDPQPSGEPEAEPAAQETP